MGDDGRVPTADEEPKSSAAPRSGLILMLVIVIALALVALYANVQKARRDQIEKVTIIPSSPAPSPTPQN